MAYSINNKLLREERTAVGGRCQAFFSFFVEVLLKGEGEDQVLSCSHHNKQNVWLLGLSDFVCCDDYTGSHGFA